MAGRQMERQNSSGKLSKILFEDEVYGHLEMSSKRGWNLLEKDWGRWLLLWERHQKKDEVYRGNFRRINPDIFRQVCIQRVCALSSRYAVVWTLGYQPGYWFEITQAEEAVSPLPFCHRVREGPNEQKSFTSLSSLPSSPWSGREASN